MGNINGGGCSGRSQKEFDAGGGEFFDVNNPPVGFSNCSEAGKVGEVDQTKAVVEENKQNFEDFLSDDEKLALFCKPLNNLSNEPFKNFNDKKYPSFNFRRRRIIQCQWVISRYVMFDSDVVMTEGFKISKDILFHIIIENPFSEEQLILNFNNDPVYYRKNVDKNVYYRYPRPGNHKTDIPPHFVGILTMIKDAMIKANNINVVPTVLSAADSTAVADKLPPPYPVHLPPFVSPGGPRLWS